jgi:Spy/CpxP family protein refolding chaperone
MNLNRQRIAMTLAGVGLVASLFFAGAATAAPGGGGGPRGGGNHEKRFEKMQAELGLTTDQASRIKAIMESNKDEMKQLHEQMKSTYTPEQQAQMKSWRENRTQGQRPSREEMKAKMDGLGLSEGQRQQLKSYREQIKTKRESIRSQIQAILTPEQQAQMEAKKAEFRGKNGGKGKGGRGDRGGRTE